MCKRTKGLDDVRRLNNAHLLNGILAIVVSLCSACTAMAELTKTKLSKSDFGAIEYKIRLDIAGIDPKAPIDETMAKIANALDMCDVKSSVSGPGRRAYVGAPGLKLQKNNYILRMGSPSSFTLKLRTTNLDDVVRLEGENFTHTRNEIDHPGTNVYSISYRISLNAEQDYPDGIVNGRTLMGALEERVPDLAKHLQSLLGDAQLVIPPQVETWGSRADIKAGTLKLHPESLGMDLDIFRFPDDIMAELSFKGGVNNSAAAAAYKEFTTLLKEKGLLADRQMTKTSWYLDYWFARHPDRLESDQTSAQ